MFEIEGSLDVVEGLIVTELVVKLKSLKSKGKERIESKKSSK